MSRRLCKNCCFSRQISDDSIWCEFMDKEFCIDQEAIFYDKDCNYCWHKGSRNKRPLLDPDERRARLSEAGRRGGQKSKRGLNRSYIIRDSLVVVKVRPVDRDVIHAYAKATGRTIADVVHRFAEECRRSLPPAPAPEPRAQPTTYDELYDTIPPVPSKPAPAPEPRTEPQEPAQAPIIWYESAPPDCYA